MNTENAIIKRIKKLLTLAEDKGATQSEVENAMAMAQCLMTKYNISLANIESEADKKNISHEFYCQKKSAINPADKEFQLFCNASTRSELFSMVGVA